MMAEEKPYVYKPPPVRIPQPDYVAPQSKTQNIVYGCPICTNNDTIKCSSCQIKHLQIELNKLRNELAKLSIDRIDELHLKYYQQIEIKKYFIRTPLPVKFEYESKLSNAYFFTLTFDPTKFGLHEYENERKEYILWTLTKYRHLYFECWGSFEYHKNGIIHAHAIIITGQPKELYQKIQPMFTDKEHNKYAVDYGKAKYPQAEEYITKISTCYFYTNGTYTPPKKPNYSDIKYEGDFTIDSPPPEPINKIVFY